EPVARRAFKRECAIWAQASIVPGIFPVYGITEVYGVEGRYFIRMPGVLPGRRGETNLGELLKAEQLSLDEIIFLAGHIANAVAGAQNVVSGIVHGDLKPTNVLLWRGLPCVSDFGIARAAGWSVQGDILFGTKAYCSPHALDPHAELTEA